MNLPSSVFSLIFNVKQYYNKNYLKNEIEWYKIKQREDEIKNKYTNNYNKQKHDDDLAKKELYKDIVRNNKMKMKKFANLANKMNIEKFKMQRKINNNNLNKDDCEFHINLLFAFFFHHFDFFCYLYF